MKYFAFLILFLLYACEIANMPKDINKNKNKNKNIKMKVTTDPSIKLKK